jgi:dihydroorotase
LSSSQSVEKSTTYDLLLKGGRVIDPKNGVDGTMDVAIANGKVARLAEGIAEADASKVVDVSGLLITPGLIDIHVHYFTAVGPFGISPDDHSFPSGVTTAVDVGTAGWANFEDFKTRVIDHARCRVLALVNVVSTGMAVPETEQILSEMDAERTAEMALKYPEIVVGIKTAHYMQPGWGAVDCAVKAGELAKVPAMFDFAPRPERSYRDLLLEKLRPGDIHTHIYARHIPSLDADLKVCDYIWEARRRGVIFDLGHGGGSFWFRIAVPDLEQGYYPDSISTDQHAFSVHGPVFDMITVCSKMLNLGMPLHEVIYRSTVTPAQEINRPQLGTLTEGSEADVAVFSLDKGEFGFWDCGRGKIAGSQRLTCQMTLRAGQIVHDLNGMSMPTWQSLGPAY